MIKINAPSVLVQKLQHGRRRHNRHGRCWFSACVCVIVVRLAPQSNSPAPPCWRHMTMSSCLHPHPHKRCPPWVSSTLFTTSEACFIPLPVGQSWHFLDHADIHTLFRAIWPPRSALRLHFHSLRHHLFVISPLL